MSQFKAIKILNPEPGQKEFTSIKRASHYVGRGSAVWDGSSNRCAIRFVRESTKHYASRDLRSDATLSTVEQVRGIPIVGDPMKLFMLRPPGSSRRPASRSGPCILIAVSEGLMPLLHPCPSPGCSQLTKGGRCDAHKSEPDRYRGKTAERGYDAAWRRFRLWFLGQYPVCIGSNENQTAREPLANAHHLVPATDVHHIKKVRDFPELRLVESNCLPQCHACHTIRTGRGE